MLDVATPDDIEILPVKKLGQVAGVFAARGKDFVTQAVDALKLGFEGIEGDIHAGHVRRSSSREPWYPRGTRNAQRAAIVDRGRRRARHRRRAHGHRRDQGRNGSAPISCSTACRACRCCRPARCCSSKRRHHQGRRAERAVPDRRQIDRRACRHGRRRGSSAAVPEGREAPARAGRLGREAGHDRAGEEVSVRVPEQWIYRLALARTRSEAQALRFFAAPCAMSAM